MTLTKRVPVLFSPEEYNKLKDLAKKKKKPVGSFIRESIEGTLKAEEQKKRLQSFARLKAMELNLPEWEAVEEFLKEWRTEELLRSAGKIKLDIDLKKSRESRDINR